MATKNKNRTVHDIYQTAYQLTGKIGEGGQGVVCTTEHPGVLVKVLTERDEQARRRWVNHLNWLLNQDLEGLHIASPRALIERPTVGYVMESMDGLRPLQQILETSQQALAGGQGLSGYVATGGLRRRLALLRELAHTVAGLHARGLAYGDLSPANVFVSESIEHHQLWLIDCDNICTSERAGHGHLHTPGYGAPEVVRGERGVNSLTDAWSFAVLAFELLSHGHPFKGDDLLDDDPEEAEARALRGELPWVDHPNDRSNALTGGIPRPLVASPRMQSLFDACFNAGRDDPLQRPSVAEWADTLDAAWSTTVTCNNADCGSSFFWSEDGSCPVCDQAQPEVLTLRHSWYCPDDDEQTDYLDSDSIRVLPVFGEVDLHLAPAGTREYAQSEWVCTLKLADDGLWITPTPGGTVWLRRLDDGKTVSLSRRQRLKLASQSAAEYALHLTPLDATSARPAWRFNW